MTNPYDPLTGKWLTPFSWAPIASPPAVNPADLVGATPEVPRDPGPNSGSAENKGVSGQDNGYNGKVDNWADFGKALGWGLSSMGPTGILNAGLTGITGKPTTVMSALFSLLGGGKKEGTGNLSGGQLDINPNNAGGFGAGAFAGMGGTGLGINAAQGAAMGPGNNLSSGVFDFAGPANAANLTDTFDRSGPGAGGDFNAGGGGNNADKNQSDRQGFATGGYTGDIPRGAVAGPVHGQEFVLSAPATHAIGPDLLAALNAALSRHHIPFGWGAAR